MRAEAAEVGSGRGSRDSKSLQHWIRALQLCQAIEKDAAKTLLSFVERQARLRGRAPALIDEQEEVTYGELVARARAYADWATAQGLVRGDVVCIMMPNCAAYVAIWLGLTHIGCVVALINTNLAGAGLAHCVRVADPYHIIVDDSLSAGLVAALEGGAAGAALWRHGSSANSLTPIGETSRRAGGRGRPVGTAVSETDPALLIFTSGTTGLPKAAYVTHGRILEWSGWFAGMMDARPEDRLYDCLPMYHSVGGVVAVGAMLYAGATLVIRRQFSASRFWPDVVATGCTIFQYIGELCRYLLRGPEAPEAQLHRLRLCCGNGLRGDVWAEFQMRFAIPRVLEYYAATEGNVSLYNCEGRPGAVGRIPAFLAHRFPVALIRLDETTGLPLRDVEGRCMACDADEIGEAIGRVDLVSGTAARRFDGYTDREATGRKLLDDVFSPGDLWFRTGDLMRRDKFGYFYFVDRLGFSFRWKGENVSAAEVASVIMQCEGVADAVVYGVAVPGTEGRAGMAAVVGDERLSLSALRAHLAAHLPPFGRPLFIRLCRSIPMTSTFKLRTEGLAREGLMPSDGADSLWFNGPGADQMVICDEDLLARIMAGSVRL